MSLILKMNGWDKFEAVKDDRIIGQFLREVADESEQAFKRGMRSGKSGRRVAGRKRASAPGEYPADQGGTLIRSIRSRVTVNSSTVGSNAPHSIFLAAGTRKMAKRKMSREALGEGIAAARPRLRGWATWQ